MRSTSAPTGPASSTSSWPERWKRHLVAEPDGCFREVPPLPLEDLPLFFEDLPLFPEALLLLQHGAAPVHWQRVLLALGAQLLLQRNNNNVGRSSSSSNYRRAFTGKDPS